MTFGSFALVLIDRFPVLNGVPADILVNVIEPLYEVYSDAKSGSNEINELQGDRP